MISGYMGKILWVNLSQGTIREECPDEKLYRDYYGGYGPGVKMLYDRLKAGIDPLGPENIPRICYRSLDRHPSPGRVEILSRRQVSVDRYLGRFQLGREFRSLSQICRVRRGLFCGLVRKAGLFVY